ncbi:MAG: carboxymuconolactone decarboxylase family protein [Caldilineae bacterium]|nr:MAG: carboxymuconolactone decarboxylase family protein [Caldilineae bacterium]
MAQLPKPYREFQDHFPEVWQAYDRLGATVHGAGPLDERSRALVKLAMAIGAQQEGAVHAHVRKALEAGLSAAEIRHVALLTIPTLGFPATMAALTWVEDVLSAD